MSSVDTHLTSRSSPVLPLTRPSTGTQRPARAMSTVERLQKLTLPSPPVARRPLRRSNSAETRWSEIKSSTDLVESMSQLVYHSIPPNLTFAQRKAMTKNDIFSTLNPTLGYDLETLVLPRTVKIFISTLVAHLRLEVEIQVMAMVLLDRLLTSAKYDPSMPFVLHHGNWKPVTLGVCMVACKAYDDKAVFNSDFLSCQAGLTASILTNIEKNILRLIDFRVSLSVSDYQRYWFELRHLQGVPTSMKAPVHISSSPETLRRSQITGSSISKLAPSKSEFLKEHLSEDDDDDDSSTFSSSEEDSDDSDDEEKRKQRDEYFSRLLSAIKSKQYIC